MRRALSALLVLGALAAAGCGEEDKTASFTVEGADTTTPTTAPEAKPSNLKDTSTKPVLTKPTGSPPDKLVKEDIVKGKGRPARKGDKVTMHYTGVTFSTGTEFDSSWDRGEPFSLELGAGEVIEGWDKGIAGMRKGGRRKLTIPPELAYGVQGSPPDIGPNEPLVFVVDLVGLTPKPDVN
jgi:peptidylprolyl isomerase